MSSFDDDRLREKITIYDVLDLLGIHATILRADCPVCGGTLDLGGYRWTCDGCRSSGDAIGLASHITGCTMGDAMAWLSGRRKVPDWHCKSARQRALARTRRLEDVCADYGLPVAAHEGRWNHATICPRCRGTLLLQIGRHGQLWACQDCQKGASFWGSEGGSDSIALVRHITGCTFDRAVWFLGGGGPKPKKR